MPSCRFIHPPVLPAALAVLVGASPVAAAPLGADKGERPLSPLLRTEAFSVAAPELLKLSAGVPVLPRYGVAQLLEDNRMSFDEEGRLTGTYHYVYRVDSESSIQGWGLVQAVWSPWLEERPQIRVRVVTKEGREVFLDPATISEAHPGREEESTLDDRKVLRAPVPALSVGAVVEVEVRTREHRPFARSGARHNLPLVWNVPVDQARWVVELPSGKPLQVLTRGIPPERVVRETVGGRQRLTVVRHQVMPHRAPEPLQAHDQDPSPILTFSTAPSWEAVVREYLSLLEEPLREPALKALVAETVAGCTSDREKVDRLLAKVQAQVRYLALEFGEAAIVPRTPGDTLKRGYGDCKDKATLLVAMLREAGLQAHVALLRSGDGQDLRPELPGLAAFNHAIVRVEGPEPLWIDPTVPFAKAGLLPAQDSGRWALVVAPGTTQPVQTPAVRVDTNQDLERREIFLEEEGPGRVVETTQAVGQAEIALRGRFYGAKPELLKENLKTYVKNTYDSEVINRAEVGEAMDLTTPFKLVLEASKAGRATTTMTDARVALNPWPLVSTLNQGLQPGEPEPGAEPEASAGAEKGTRPRRTDLQFLHPWSAAMTWVIHPPKGYSAEALPEGRELAFGPAKLAMQWHSLPDGSVEAVYRFECAQTRWTPKEVETARAALKTFGEESSPVVLFQETGEAHLLAGRFREAAEAFRAVAAAEPKAFRPWLRLAKVQLQAGLGEAARESLRRAISLAPEREEGHRQLGWVLEHDALGRRFSPGWDRAGAIQALRKAMTLAPEMRMARLDLAILLEHDAQGNRYTSKDLEEAAKLYRDQLTWGKDDRAQENLTVLLVRMGRFGEAAEAARGMANAAERSAWLLVATACAKGGDAAVQEARRTLTDPDARFSALQRASEVLLGLRRYPEAGLLAQAGQSASEEGMKMQSRVALCRKLKRYEDLPMSQDTPLAAVRAFVKACTLGGIPPKGFFEGLTPAQRPKVQDQAAMAKEMKAFGLFARQDGDWRDRSLDEFLSVWEFGQEGSQELGFRLQSQHTGPFPTTFFVAFRDGRYQVVAWNTSPGRLGLEAQWEVERGHSAAACEWINRAYEALPKPVPQEPLSGHPLTHLWSKGKTTTEVATLRRAADLLVASEGIHPEVLTRLRQQEAGLEDPAQRGALLRAAVMLASRGKAMKDLEAVSQRLHELYPKDPMAILTRVGFLVESDRRSEAMNLLEAAQSGRDPSPELVSALANLQGFEGRLSEARVHFNGLLQQGKPTPSLFNSLAWNDVCREAVTEQTLEWIQRAVDGRRASAFLHTQASAMAALGRVVPARKALVASMQRDGAPRPIDWYVVGRIAEALGETAMAKTSYARVALPGEDPPEKADDRTSCRYLAQQRILALEKEVPRAGRP